MNKKFYVLSLLFSILFIWIGNLLVSESQEAVPIGSHVVSARVLEIVSRTENTHITSGGVEFTNLFIIFSALITSGEESGQEVNAEFTSFGPTGLVGKEIEIGDRIVLLYSDFADTFLFMDYERINYIIILGVALIALIIVLGKIKGVNSLIALAFTCMSIFFILIPAILSGRNVYVVALAVCVFSVLSTFSIVIGPSKKAAGAAAGCLGGISLAAILMFSMDTVLNLTGLIDHETRSLFYFSTDTPLNIRAIVFAGVVIGSSGAIMDVAMSISSSLWEISRADSKTNFAKLFKSGIEIGKDILGTMLNTLILAYIGTSLSLLLLINAQTTSFIELFNTEMVIVELLRSMVGAFGMLLAVPLTAGVCGRLYTTYD